MYGLASHRHRLSHGRLHLRRNCFSGHGLLHRHRLARHRLSYRLPHCRRSLSLNRNLAHHRLCLIDNRLCWHSLSEGKCGLLLWRRSHRHSRHRLYCLLHNWMRKWLRIFG